MKTDATAYVEDFIKSTHSYLDWHFTFKLLNNNEKIDQGYKVSPLIALQQMNELGMVQGGIADSRIEMTRLANEIVLWLISSGEKDLAIDVQAISDLANAGSPKKVREKWPEVLPRLKIKTLMSREATPSAGEITEPPIFQQGQQLKIIWKHYERSYSIDGVTQYAVSEEIDNLLTAFLENGTAMESRELEDKSGCSNASISFKKLAEFAGGIFAAGIRSPGGKKASGGYYALVRNVSAGG